MALVDDLFDLKERFNIHDGNKKAVETQGLDLNQHNGRGDDM